MKLMHSISAFLLQDATQGNIRFNRTGNNNYASNGKSLAKKKKRKSIWTEPTMTQKENLK